jgi:hypothetical protein
MISHYAIRRHAMNRKTACHFARRIVLLGSTCLAATACGPRLSSDDLGTTLHRLPKVPGADQPYPMPQLDQPPPDEKAADEPAAGDPATAEVPAAEAPRPVVPRDNSSLKVESTTQPESQE